MLVKMSVEVEVMWKRRRELLWVNHSALIDFWQQHLVGLGRKSVV